jgi:hypothetical protein
MSFVNKSRDTSCGRLVKISPYIGRLKIKRQTLGNNKLQQKLQQNQPISYNTYMRTRLEKYDGSSDVLFKQKAKPFLKSYNIRRFSDNSYMKG